MSASVGPGLCVELRGLQLHRDGRPVLRDVSWTVRPGERWVVIGANGAGKTQLLKILSGAVWPDALPGTRCYRRGRARFETPHEVMQDIVYVGPEQQDKYQRYQWDLPVAALVGTGVARSDIPLRRLAARERARVRAALRALDIERLARRRFLSLSWGERRLVLLARAQAARPRLLLLDEALGGLDPLQRRSVTRWLARQRQRTRSWILSTHRAEEIPRAATHLLRLEGGRVIESRLLRATDRRPAAKKTDVGADERRRRVGRRPPDAADDATPLVRFVDASLYLDYRRILEHVNWTVCAGDCWVVTGANGAGKTTLLRALWGDFGPALGGRIERRGIAPGVPLEQFRQRCGWVAPSLQTEYPRHWRALDAVVSGLHASVGLNEAATPAERRRAHAALREFGLSDLARRPLAELSYGQVRRLMFARAWVNRPQLLLLDEPFGGIDAATRADLLRRIEALRARGVAVVLSTHHRDEWPDPVTGLLRLARGAAQVVRGPAPYPRSARPAAAHHAQHARGAQCFD